MDKEVLLSNIDKVHTTEMGIDRIKKNLKIDTNDVVEHCKNNGMVYSNYYSISIYHYDRSSVR